MPIILHIETATKVCSVALSNNGNLISLKESHEDYTHAENLTVFIEEVVKNASIKLAAIDAVAVSKGPGSYTGLRIGVSTAKGICFALDKPLISVNTLQSMASGINYDKKIDSSCLFCPMIDARRMEVYCAIYDFKNNEIKQTAAEIITENSFSERLSSNKIVFFGDGAAKCKPIIGKHTNAIFIEDFLPSAKYMTPIAEKAWNNRQFENVAYFEPFYLKDFVSQNLH